MYTDQKLFASLFLLQIFSSFLVLAGHYTADVDDYIQWTFWEEALNQLSRYGTVLLTIITGFFTARSLDGHKATAKAFFSAKLIYVYLPFLVCSILFFFVFHKRMPVTAEDAKNILVGNSAGHLYYIFMICQYYVFAYLFRGSIHKRNILFICVLFVCMQYWFINGKEHGWLGLGVRSFLPAWLFTFYLGHLLYHFRANIFGFMEKHRLLPAGLLLLSFAATGYFVSSPYLFTANHLTFVLATFILLLSFASVFNLVTGHIRLPFQKGLTFYIYLLHPLFIIYANKFVTEHFHLEQILSHKGVSTLYLVGIFAATFLGALLCSRLTQKLARPKTRQQLMPSS